MCRSGLAVGTLDNLVLVFKDGAPQPVRGEALFKPAGTQEATSPVFFFGGTHLHDDLHNSSRIAQCSFGSTRLPLSGLCSTCYEASGNLAVGVLASLLHPLLLQAVLRGHSTQSGVAGVLAVTSLGASTAGAKFASPPP